MTMRESKRKRLAMKGWQIGSTTDFLGLSPEEEAYVELKLRLADGLRKRRLKSRLTQQELAKAVRSSQSRVAKMEAGDPTVTVDLLVRALLALGATRREVARIISSSGALPAA
jgi:DNA-binding XRE family transcriptional regulator